MNRPDLTSPSELRSFIRRHGLAPRKGLGQHWLFAKSAVDAICSAVPPAGGILEIGPGPGVLTQRLVEIAPIITLDVDSRVGEALAESAPEAKFVLGDVLEEDLAALLARLEPPRVVVSNLPYYITAAVVERIWSAARQRSSDEGEVRIAGLSSRTPELSHAVLMMQREVAERIAAQPGDARRGSLSVFVQLSFDVSTVARVQPGAFLPPPKVESTVLKLETRQVETPNSTLQPLIRAGFKQPRKTLVNNLGAAGMGREAVEAALAAAGLDLKVRPHALTEEQWIRLAELIHTPRS